MTRRQVRKVAEGLVKEGLGRQQIYDALKLQGTGLEDEPLARIVRYTPSQAARQVYKVPHAILLVLLWLTAVGKSLAGLGLAVESGRSWIWVLLLPLLTIILGVLIAMYRTRAYHTIAILSIISLVRFASRTDWQHFDPWNTIDLIVGATLIALGWYLLMKVASNYEVVTNVDGSKSILFPPEPVTNAT